MITPRLLLVKFVKKYNWMPPVQTLRQGEYRIHKDGDFISSNWVDFIKNLTEKEIQSSIAQGYLYPYISPSTLLSHLAKVENITFAIIVSEAECRCSVINTEANQSIALPVLKNEILDEKTGELVTETVSKLLKTLVYMLVHRNFDKNAYFTKS